MLCPGFAKHLTGQQRRSSATETVNHGNERPQLHMVVHESVMSVYDLVGKNDGGGGHSEHRSIGRSPFHQTEQFPSGQRFPFGSVSFGSEKGVSFRGVRCFPVGRKWGTFS